MNNLPDSNLYLYQNTLKSSYINKKNINLIDSQTKPAASSMKTTIESSRQAYNKLFKKSLAIAEQRKYHSILARPLVIKEFKGTQPAYKNDSKVVQKAKQSNLDKNISDSRNLTNKNTDNKTKIFDLSKSIQNFKSDLDQLEPNSKVILGTHVNSDGDGLAAALALKMLISKLKPALKVSALSPDETLNTKYQFLQKYGQLKLLDAATESELNANLIDYFISLDVPVLDRLGKLKPYLYNAKRSLKIDEHTDSVKHNFTDSHICDSSSRSSGEIVFKIAKHLSPELIEDENFLSLIYYSFVHDNQKCLNNPAYQDIKNFFKTKKVDTDGIDTLFKPKLTKAQKQVLAQALEQTDYHKIHDLDVAITFINTNDYLTVGESALVYSAIKDELINANNKPDLQFIVTASAVPNKQSDFKVSMTRNDLGLVADIDLTLMARALSSTGDGGGHPGAAGAKILGDDEQTIFKMKPNIKPLTTLEKIAAIKSQILSMVYQNIPMHTADTDLKYYRAKPVKLASEQVFI